MDYLGQSGDKALVNDRGRILRLPFAGDGKPPEPGIRITPKQDSYYCPKNVDLVPGQDDDKGKRDPRRTSANKELNLTSNKFIGFNPYRTDFNKFKVVFGYDTSEVTEKGENPGHGEEKFFQLGTGYRCLIYTEDSLLFPLPQLALMWDFGAKRFQLINVNRHKIFYVWSEGTYGTYQDSNRRVLTLAKKIKPNLTLDLLNKPTQDSVKRPLIIKVLDTNRRFFTDGNGNIFSNRPGQANILMFAKSHPLGQLWVAPEPECNLEVLKAWYKNPEDKRFKYERLY